MMWSGRLSGNATDRRATWVFTKRGGGVSVGAYESLNLAYHVGDDSRAVRINRDRVAALLGTSPDRTRFIRATHGADVHYVTDDVDYEVPEGDGLITRDPGVGLVALAADCVPIVLADVDRGVAAVTHCGWAGVVAGVVAAVVDGMLDQGARPERIRAIAGPAICGRCYEVPLERQDAVTAIVPDAGCVTEFGRPAVDVRRAVVVQLGAAGVETRTVGGCTAEDRDMFSSRRDAVTGRQAGAIIMTRGNFDASTLASVS